MDAQQISLFDNLIFQVPNLLLAMLMYTIIGRLVLMFMFPPNSPNYIWRAFVRITDPVLSAVRFMTPAAVPLPVLLFFSVVWVFALRIALFFLIAKLGFGPQPA
jgi:YggT family protein